MLQHPLIISLTNLRGNPRACVYTEPLWGIPYNLYIPYMSVYMLALGVKDQQIGLIVSVGMAFQIVFALLGGAITDKFGRKATTFFVDFIAWSVPCIIWALAQDFTWFLIAAMINSAWRITSNSWTCLMVEDAQTDQLMDIYTWVYISGLLSAFFAPIAGLLISRFTLVPTMRGLLVFALILMTAKFFILFVYSTETGHGKIRQAETRGKSIVELLSEYRSVFHQILKSPVTLYTLGAMLVMSIFNAINGSFWSVLVTEKLHILPQYLAIYPFVRSAVMLVFFFIAMPRIREMNFRNPMLVSFGVLFLSQVVLIAAPEKGYFWLGVNTILEACAYATVSTQIDRMQVVNINPQERARILSILYVLVIAITSPFGWIAGNLSAMDKIYPFFINLVLFVIGFVIVLRTSAYQKRANAR